MFWCFRGKNFMTDNASPNITDFKAAFFQFLRGFSITTSEPFDFHPTTSLYSLYFSTGNHLRQCFVVPWAFPHSARAEEKPLQIFKPYQLNHIALYMSKPSWSPIGKATVPKHHMMCWSARQRWPLLPKLSWHTHTQKCTDALLCSRTRWLSDSGAVLSLCEIALEWVWW